MSPEDFARTFKVPEEKLKSLALYHALLVKWQKAVNLISPTTLNDIWPRHFADSAQLASLLPENSTIADLGSGGGFPGMVIAILRPDIKMHLIESDSKKSEFLKNVSRETGIIVSIHNDRVEKILKTLAPDIITARAFAPLIEILKMIPENCKKTEMLLLKGKTALEEIETAKKKFSFNVKMLPSVTSGEAHILKISPESHPL